VSVPALLEAIAERARNGGDHEVHLVAPALNSRLRHHLSDLDGAVAAARLDPVDLGDCSRVAGRPVICRARDGGSRPPRPTAGSVKDGQPVPDSNLAVESKSSASQAAQWYMPSSLVLQWGLANGRSVPPLSAYPEVSSLPSGVAGRSRASS
jgi:hypothetical protein